eukprot:gene32492-37459_t
MTSRQSEPKGEGRAAAGPVHAQKTGRSHGTANVSLTVEDPETDRLAQAVAAATGEPLVVAVRTALAERLQRVSKTRVDPPNLAKQLMEIGRHCAAAPDLDPRSADEIIGYDEH